ncbi:uncharacterized protein LOC111912600 [Lactuca sativa]|uniref:Uncharacterized protein n=1 Tax=Lactuca sativa TaxID=4236 RepID=A0A9R1W5A3_LACSA|nr:uncharacterized protein LOC111912600 [Lactuca sativa]KAJ0216188.1 hypothetical protein LSAT_V11C300123830 [Lactuca sativa]
MWIHHHAIVHKCCFLLCIILLQTVYGANLDILNVGEELQKETLPLQSGSRIYQLQGLKPNHWYEVKISYPASIPASFSLQLKKENPNFEPKHQRKLLNTEKLIFKNDDEDLQINQSGMYVMLTVETEGVVAIPNGKEREMVIYNIVCDELLLGIPHKAWWVVMFVIICLGVAFVIPSFLPSLLITTDRMPLLASKNS